jgi:hypothetical protein
VFGGDSCEPGTAAWSSDKMVKTRVSPLGDPDCKSGNHIETLIISDYKFELHQGLSTSGVWGIVLVPFQKLNAMHLTVD